MKSATAVMLWLLASTFAFAQETKGEHRTDETGKHYTFKTSADGAIETDKDGKVILLETDVAIAKPAPAASVKTLKIDVTEDCRTNPTGTTRRACWSDGTTITLPAGYVFVKDSLIANHVIRYGSENNDYVDWSNYVDVIPGIQAPRTIRVWVHARSGRDHGERGRTKTRFVCDYVRIP